MPGLGTDTCPSCGGTGIVVVDSRARTVGRYRRRRCLGCHHGWATVEVPAEENANRAALATIRAAEKALQQLRISLSNGEDHDPHQADT
jgi:transcriptional regulator NrdR family protein